MEFVECHEIVIKINTPLPKCHSLYAGAYKIHSGDIVIIEALNITEVDLKSMTLKIAYKVLFLDIFDLYGYAAYL